MIRAQARLAGILEFSIEQAANELSRALMLSSKAPDPLEDQDKLKCMVDLAHCYAHPALKQYEKCVNLATSIIQLLQRVKAKTMQSGITVTDIERKMIELLDRNKFVIPEMLFLRAGSNFELKKFKDALSDFVELEHALAVKSDMRIPSAQKKLIKLKKAMCFAQLGEFANAIDESTVYLKSVDHDLEIHDSDLLMKALDVRGTCYYRTLQLGKALEDFKAACSIRPLRQDIYEKFVRVSNINGDEIEKIGSNIKESFSGRSGVIDVKMIEEAKAMVYPLALHIFSNKDKSTTAEAEALVNQSVTSIIQEVKKIAELNSKKAEKKTN
jgi:tetratricopeptide (TPR) repeat protein